MATSARFGRGRGLASTAAGNLKPDNAGTAEKAEKPKQSAKKYALWLLGRREWSEKELRQRLAVKGYEESEISECLEFCQQHGFQSDERFAASRIRSRASTRGNRRLTQELSQKGVEPGLAATLLAQAGGEEERACAAARKFEGKPWSVELKAKVWRFLAARGFSSQAIKAALGALQSAATSDDCTSANESSE